MAVYQPDRKGFTQLATSRRVAKHMRFVGEHWAAELRQFRPPGGTGDYADSVTVEPVTVSINGLPRAAVEIAANTPYAAILEIGSHDIDVPPRPLTKLLDRIEDADPGQNTKNRG